MLACYILVQLLLKEKHQKLSFKLLTSQKLDCSYMQILSCFAYVYLYKEKVGSLYSLQKLNKRAVFSYLIRYNSLAIYCIQLLLKNKILCTRNVIFNKTLFYYSLYIRVRYRKLINSIVTIKQILKLSAIVISYISTKNIDILI